MPEKKTDKKKDDATQADPNAPKKIPKNVCPLRMMHDDTLDGSADTTYDHVKCIGNRCMWFAKAKDRKFSRCSILEIGHNLNRIAFNSAAIGTVADGDDEDVPF